MEVPLQESVTEVKVSLEHNKNQPLKPYLLEFASMDRKRRHVNLIICFQADP